MSLDPARIPVILGVGEINDRPAPDEPGLDSAELMIAAARAAEAEAGGGLIATCDRVLVIPQISFREIDVVRRLSEGLGLPAARISQPAQASGDTPIRHLNDAANAIGAGEARVCVILGGEALRTAAQRAKAAGVAGGLFQGSRSSAPPLRLRYGVITPSEIYPLYENATRAAWGQTLGEAQAETGEIWAKMSEVAAEAEGAWLKTPRTPAEIVAPTAANRPIAFPYTKLMVANAAVNQGAALVVTSLAVARERGLEDRAIFVRRGAAAHESEDPLERADWTTPPGMETALRRALSVNGLGAQDLDLVELYSCFPCVPKMARRILDWPLDRPATVHGGLTFGGGPIGNYMSHAAAAMVRRLRQGGRYGLLFANGGHCTHNHAIVLSRTAPDAAEFPQDYDFQAEADAARGPIPPLTDEYEGPARLETYTVVYDAAGQPAYGVVLARAPSGVRVIARVEPEDAATIAFLTDGRRAPVGTAGLAERRGEALAWRPLDAV
jgi:acetyl-CoA C-acetyltransferase